MNRVICSIFVSMFVLTASETFSQNEDRVWRVGEQVIEGKLVTLDSGIVELRTMVGQRRTLPIELLSEKDKNYLVNSIEDIVRIDREQLELVSKKMSSLLINPESIIEELKGQERGTVRSPYAPLVLGVANALENGDHSTAGKHFAKSLNAIKKSRRFLGEDYLRSAFNSTVNNLGVVAVKKIKGDNASKMFFQAMTEGKLPFSVRYNADLLSKIVSESPGFELNSRAKRKLSQLSKIKPSSEFRVSSEAVYFLYDLKWESPPDDEQLNQLLKKNGLPLLTAKGVGNPDFSISLKGNSTTLNKNFLFPDLWCTFCRGRGSYSCNARNCINGEVMRKVKKISRIGPNGQPMYFDDWVVDHKCKNCKGRRVLKCPHCTKGKLPAHR